MQMNARRILPVIASALLLQGPAFAHEAPARHGGVVRTVNDLQYELVQKGPDALIYVDNHGKPVPTAAMTGSLVVLRGAEKTEFKLEPAGEGHLLAKGAKAGSGAKAVAVINAPGAKAITVRFVVK
jgi:hypothetical protein